MDEITLCTKGVTTLLLWTLQQVTQQPSVQFFLVTVLAQFKVALPLLSVDKPQEMLPVRRRRFHGDIQPSWTLPPSDFILESLYLKN